MKEWSVTFQVKGTASIEVKAETEDEALEKASTAISIEELDDWDIDKRSAEIFELEKKGERQ